MLKAMDTDTNPILSLYYMSNRFRSLYYLVLTMNVYALLIGMASLSSLPTSKDDIMAENDAFQMTMSQVVCN